jgi:urocanate hydratase
MVLWNNPTTGVLRHSDAGYKTAIECVQEFGPKMPSLDSPS